MLGGHQSPLESRIKLWKSVAFINALQKTMVHSKLSDVNDTNAEDAWQTFTKLVEIIEPNICIMWGAKMIQKWLERQPSLSGKRIWHDGKINGFKERTTSPIDIGAHKLPIVAITHPSNITPRYEPHTWHKYLMMHFGNELSSLLK